VTYDMRRLGVARLDQTIPDGAGCRFGARGCAKFRQDIRDMGLRGAVADEEAVADFGVGETVGDQTQHLTFPRGEL
jgi:hypothetical protein